jgi:acetoacetyl-CoA synthetase
VPEPGSELDDAALQRIRDALRRELSPRHVPDEVHAVAAIPRTLSGKKLEVPAKRILSGEAARDVASRDALANPESLDALEELAGRRMRP